MKQFNYPDVMNSIILACHKHLRKEITIDEFQQQIRNGENTIVSLEEKKN